MKNSSAYLKMRVLGAIDYAKGKTLSERIQDVAQTQFIDEDGNSRKFTWRTIFTWYYRYKNYGITGMNKSSRSDKGSSRKTTPEELLEAINQALPHFHNQKYNRMDVYRFCIEKGLLRQENIAQTTFYRYTREYELFNNNFEDNKRRLAFSMQYANQLWQADTMCGPFVKNDTGKMIQAKLIAFLDDASRVICHGQFFWNETIDSLIICLKSAFYKRGIPEQLYVDNGSIYCSQEITLVCARIGCILRHAPVRDGAAKGKIERFFRTVRDQFLGRILDLSSIDSLNKQFTLWVENEYNSSVHSATGLKPVDRFALDISRIKFLPPSENNDEIFYAEDTRKVRKDNTFPFANIRYEAPSYMPDKEIHVLYDRKNSSRIIVYYKGQRLGEAKKLNLIENGLRRSSLSYKNNPREGSHD
jgi:transposase InsO family protein